MEKSGVALVYCLVENGGSGNVAGGGVASAARLAGFLRIPSKVVLQDHIQLWNALVIVIYPFNRFWQPFPDSNQKGFKFSPHSTLDQGLSLIHI